MIDYNFKKEEKITQLLKDKERLIIKVKELENTRHGLIWEDHPEKLDNHDIVPLLRKDKKLSIIAAEDKPLNYLIEGDNYHALQALQRTHKGKVDVIYIDPPYNTGNNEFTYIDKFTNGTDNFRHSEWLSFMYRRLSLAKELLTDDGVIFVSIDDNEQAHLKLLMDKVFGEKNFISTLLRKTTNYMPKTTNNELQTLHDYILMYGKNKQKVVLGKEVVGEHKFPYKDEKGEYRLKVFQSTGNHSTRRERPNLYYPIYYSEKEKKFYLEDAEDRVKILPRKVRNEDGRWMWSKKRFLKDRHTLAVRNGKIFRKEYKSDVDDIKKYRNYSSWLDNYMNREGSQVLKEMGLDSQFSYPKPVGMIKHLLIIANKKDALVLDFFAGSGTTGHAVMELNKEDGGNRQFILCTNNEVSEEKEREYLEEKGYIEKPHKRLYNKFKKEHPEQYEAFLRSEEYQQLGIARAVTRERLKCVIEGYTTPRGNEVEGLPNNLVYLKALEREPLFTVFNESCEKEEGF